MNLPPAELKLLQQPHSASPVSLTARRVADEDESNLTTHNPGEFTDNMKLKWEIVDAVVGNVADTQPVMHFHHPK